CCLKYQFSGRCRVERGGAEHLKCDPMQVGFPFPLHGEVGLQMFGAYHILQNGVCVVSETKYYERLRENSMLGVERENSKCHARFITDLYKPLELLIHDFMITNTAPEHRLVQNNGQFHRGLSGENLLPLHSDFDQTFDHSWGDRLNLVVTADNVPSVPFGLQQARYNLNVPYINGRGFMFQSDELLVI